SRDPRSRPSSRAFPPRSPRDGLKGERMPSFQTTRRVPYSPRQMFDLVADVERYPEFLPLCEGLTVRSRKTTEASTVLVATMAAGYKAFHERFTTRVELFPDEPRVLVAYLDGPFKRLHNRWLFRPAPGGSQIDFYIDYELRSMVLDLLVGS